MQNQDASSPCHTEPPLGHEDSTTSLDQSTYPTGKKSLWVGSIKYYQHCYCKLNSSHRLRRHLKQSKPLSPEILLTKSRFKLHKLHAGQQNGYFLSQTVENHQLNQMCTRQGQRKVGILKRTITSFITKFLRGALTFRTQKTPNTVYVTRDFLSFKNHTVGCLKLCISVYVNPLLFP